MPPAQLCRVTTSYHNKKRRERKRGGNRQGDKWMQEGMGRIHYTFIHDFFNCFSSRTLTVGKTERKNKLEERTLLGPNTRIITQDRSETQDQRREKETEDIRQQ